MRSVARGVCHVLGWPLLAVGLGGWVYVLLDGAVFETLRHPVESGADRAARQLAALPIGMFGLLTLIGVVALVPALGGFRSRRLRVLLAGYAVIAFGMFALFGRLWQG